MKVSSKKNSKENTTVHFEKPNSVRDFNLRPQRCYLNSSVRKSESSLSSFLNPRIVPLRKKFHMSSSGLSRNKSRKMEGLIAELSSGDELLGLMPSCINPTNIASKKRLNEKIFSPLNPYIFLKRKTSSEERNQNYKSSNPSEEELMNFLEVRGKDPAEMWHPFCNIQRKFEEIEKEKSLSSMGFFQECEVDWNVVPSPKRRELHRIMHYRICNHINPDIVIVIKDHEFFCHRIVLQSYSEYFDELKNLDSPTHVDLSKINVTQNSFIIIYTWMLTIGQGGFQLLTKENILEVLIACQALKIKDFENQCLSFIDNEQLFKEESAYFLLKQASKLKQQAIVDLMVPRIQGFFLALVSSKDFLELSIEELITFLKSDYIIVNCEIEIFLSAVRWLKHNWKERVKHLMRVMKCVRFGLMTPLELIDIRNSPHCEFADISQEENIQKLIDEGLAIAVKSTLCNGEESKHSMLDSPMPRNWFGKQKTYNSYQEFLEFLNDVRRHPKIMYRTLKVLKLQEVNLYDEVDERKTVKSCILCKSKEQCSEGKQDTPRLGETALSSTSSRDNSCRNSAKASTINVQPQIPKTPMRMPSVTSLRREMNEEKSSSALIGELIKRQRERYESQIKEAIVTKDSDPEVLRSPSRSSRRLSLRESAATVIQAFVRGFITRRRLKKALSQADLKDSNIQERQESEPQHLCEESLPKVDEEISKEEQNILLLPSSPKTDIKRELSRPSSLFFLYQESILVFGGIDPNYNISPCNSGSNIYRYHPDENTWETVSTIPEPRYYHNIAHLKGRVYLAGGADPRKEELNENAVCKSVWSFDPIKRTWTAETDMLTARKNFGLVAAHGYIYAIGGQDKDDKVLSSVERYDPGTREWSWVSPLGEARVGAAICKHNHMIWVAGGVSTGGKQTITKFVECYDPKRNVWIPKAPLRFPRAFSSMLSLKGSLYLVGGASREGGNTAASTPTIDIWDERNKEWKLKTEMSIPRHGHTVSCIGSQMVILGGSTTIYMRCLPSVEAWCVARGTWIRGVSPLPAILTGHSSINLPLGAQPS